VITHQSRQGYKKGGADADESVGTQSSHVLVDLPLEPDGDSHQESDGDIEDKIKDIHSLSQHDSSHQG
jgi:hypothetical protein